MKLVQGSNMSKKSRRKNDRKWISESRLTISFSNYHPPRELGYARLRQHLESLALESRVSEYSYVLEQLLSALPDDAEMYLSSFGFFYSAECWSKSLDIARRFTNEFPGLAVSYLCLASPAAHSSFFNQQVRINYSQFASMTPAPICLYY